VKDESQLRRKVPSPKRQKWRRTTRSSRLVRLNASRRLGARCRATLALQAGGQKRVRSSALAWGSIACMLARPGPTTAPKRLSSSTPLEVVATLAAPCVRFRRVPSSHGPRSDSRAQTSRRGGRHRGVTLANRVVRRKGRSVNPALVYPSYPLPSPVRRTPGSGATAGCAGR